MLQGLDHAHALASPDDCSCFAFGCGAQLVPLLRRQGRGSNMLLKSRRANPGPGLRFAAWAAHLREVCVQRSAIHAVDGIPATIR